ncbi:MAG TPA: cytochrome c oxidase assembly protein [Gaiellales bacterium]
MLRWLSLLVLAALVAPYPASAHGGTRIVTRSEGGYRVALDALAVRSGQSVSVVDYTVYLRDARSGAQIDDATVSVLVRTRERAFGPLAAHRRGSTYEALIPVARGDAWSDYRLRVRIQGPRGDVTFAYVPSAARFDWPWRQPLVLAGALLALALYLRAWLRLRRRGRADHASLGRLVLYTSGVSLAVLSLISPVDPIGEQYLLSVHMLQHVVLGDSAPALILLGLRGPLSLLIVPRVVLRRIARLGTLRRAASQLLRPVATLGLWAVVYACWHVPAAYDYALAHQTVHDLEHLSFLIVGLLVWTLLIEPLPHPRLDLRRRILVAISLFALGTVLADTLILTPHVLYGAYATQPDRLWGISALTDQRLAGAVMMLEQLVSVGICLAFLTRAYRGADRSWRRVAA